MLVRRRTRAALQAAALFYATDRGWPVLPGTYLEGGCCSCGELRCPAPGSHPAEEAAVHEATRAADTVRAWWSCRPYAVLLATGHEFDVLDAPAAAGYAALRELEMIGSPPGPVVQLTCGRLLFLVRPGARDVYWYTLDHNDDAHLDVRHHGEGHFVPAPATSGPASWAVAPRPRDHRLPEAVELLGALVRSCQPALEEVSG